MASQISRVYPGDDGGGQSSLHIAFTSNKNQGKREVERKNFIYYSGGL